MSGCTIEELAAKAGANKAPQRGVMTRVTRVMTRVTPAYESCTGLPHHSPAPLHPHTAHPDTRPFPVPTWPPSQIAQPRFTRKPNPATRPPND